VAKQYTGVSAAVGVHPHEFNDAETRDEMERANWIETLKVLAADESVVAIGECGLDYFSRDPSSVITDDQKHFQREGFLAQIELAKALLLPLIVHCRPSLATQDAYEDVLEILQSAITDLHAVVLHCYMGDTVVTQKFLTLPRVYFSFTGNITYPTKKALVGTKDDLVESVKLVPLPRLFVETDCPFLAPQEKRGERNEPAYVRMTAEKVRTVQGVAMADLEAQLDENFQRVFVSSKTEPIDPVSMKCIMKNSLEANLRKYQLFILLQKRAFLPVIGVYLVSVGQLSLLDIATITSITMLLQLLLELPTGYFADRYGRRLSIVVGSFILSFSPLAFIVWPNYWGGLLAALLYFGGASFVGGAHSAFIHDTMQALGREKDFTKFRGRAQSYSLVGNMIMVALVPISYSVDPRLPFLFGFLLLFPVFFLALSYTEPPVLSSDEAVSLGIKSLFRAIPKTELLILFSVFGIVSSVFDNAPQFREILFQDLGISVAYFGAILAGGSLFAALAGHAIHKLDTVPHHVFYFLDVLVMIFVLLIIGMTQNPYMAILGFTLMVMYDRNRSIVAESHILARYQATANKATLLSLLRFFGTLQGLWISLALGSALHLFGTSKGFVVFGVAMGAILLALMFLYLAIEKRKVRHDILKENQ
jgi:TatD DNase family protein